VWIYTIFSWWIFSPCNMLMCTNKTGFAGVGTRPKTIFRIKNCCLSYLRKSKKDQNFLSADQTSIPGVNQVFPVLEWKLIFVLASKILDRLKRLFVIQIIQVTVYRNCGTYTFNSISLVLWRSRNEGDLFESWKIDAEKRCNQIFKKCTTIQRISSRGIIWRDLSIFEGMKKFCYRHSVKKCTKYPFDSRAHLKTVRSLWFPTFDRFENWLILSGTIRSKQYHESTMVWRNLPSYHLW